MLTQNQGNKAVERERQLAPLIATRMCHDLASPVGAVANLADMLRDTPPDQVADDLVMLCNTADRSTALLKFFRMVLGCRNASEPGVPTKSFTELAQCQAIAKRITVEIRADVDTLTAEQVQLMGLMLMVGVSLVGLRGQVVVSLSARPGELPLLTAAGEKVALSAEKRALLAGDQIETVSPSHVEFIMLSDLLSKIGCEMALDEQPGTISLALRRQIGESPAA